MKNHHRIFQKKSKGKHTSRDHEHQIECIPEHTLYNKRPYRYPHQQKGETEQMVQNMLGVGIIQPSRSSLLLPLMMVTRKDNSWRMFPDYKDINKITITNIGELLDELHGVDNFTKLDLKS